MLPEEVPPPVRLPRTLDTRPMLSGEMLMPKCSILSAYSVSRWMTESSTPAADSTGSSCRMSDPSMVREPSAGGGEQPVQGVAALGGRLLLPAGRILVRLRAVPGGDRDFLLLAVEGGRAWWSGEYASFAPMVRLEMDWMDI